MFMDSNSPASQALLAAFEAAPPFLQEFIRSGAFLAFSERLESKLAVDESIKAKVSNELLLTALGVTAPKDLPANLINEAGLPENLVGLVIEEAREGMFEPLIAQAGGESAPDLPMIVPSVPIPSPAQPTKTLYSRPVPPIPAPTQTPSTSPLATFHAELANSAPNPVPKPVPVAAPVTAPVSATPNVYETFHARTMASDIEAMGGQGAATTPVQTRTAPAEPPRYAPIVPAVQDSSLVPPQAEPVPVPTASPEAVQADLKKYGVDPYREPVA